MEEQVSQVLHSTVWGHCWSESPFCRLVSDHVIILIIVLLIKCLIFALLFIFGPPGKCKKADARSRLVIAVVASVSFYFWLTLLVLDAGLCVGLVAHRGVCSSNASDNDFLLNNNNNDDDKRVDDDVLNADLEAKEDKVFEDETVVISDDNVVGDNFSVLESNTTSTLALPLVWQVSRASCQLDLSSPSSSPDAYLLDLTMLHVFILTTLAIIVLANLREALGSRALVHDSQALCSKSEVQKFISSLVTKPPDVGHFVTCFHSLETRSPSKALVATSNGGDVSFEDPVHSGRVITYRSLEHFGFQHWRDFSEVRLVSPSARFPIVETELSLNFFPGDQPTAEKYKAFVVQLTEKHRAKDAQIAIDDYFHLEDGRQWRFLIGDARLAAPWWDRGLAKVLCALLMLGWPFRMRFQGQVASHRVEIKKAVFCLASASQDEGVSLSTPTANNAHPEAAGNNTNNYNNASDNNNSGGNVGRTVVETCVDAVSPVSPKSSPKTVMETEARLELGEEERRPLMSNAARRSREIVASVTNETKNGVDINSSLQRGPRELIQHINTFSGYETYV